MGVFGFPEEIFIYVPNPLAGAFNGPHVFLHLGRFVDDSRPSPKPLVFTHSVLKPRHLFGDPFVVTGVQTSNLDPVLTRRCVSTRDEKLGQLNSGLSGGQSSIYISS